MEKNTYEDMIQLQIAHDINWVQVRIDAAVAALQGIVSSSSQWNTSYNVVDGVDEDAAARLAVSFADSLVAELRKRYEDTGTICASRNL